MLTSRYPSSTDEIRWPAAAGKTVEGRVPVEVLSHRWPAEVSQGDLEFSEGSAGLAWAARLDWAGDPVEAFRKAP